MYRLYFSTLTAFILMTALGCGKGSSTLSPGERMLDATGFQNEAIRDAMAPLNEFDQMVSLNADGSLGELEASKDIGTLRDAGYQTDIHRPQTPN